MTAYAKKVGADVESVRFLFDGQRIEANKTVREVPFAPCVTQYLLCVCRADVTRVFAS